jgi:hypothetical protein
MVTTTEEGKHLTELGLKKDTADAYDGDNNPTWSILALLGIIERSSERYEIHLRVDKQWNIFVKPEKENEWKYFEKTEFFKGVYETVCWLLENNYVK